MYSKIGWTATIVVIALAAIVLFYPPVLQDDNQTGFFTLYFACNNNGSCQSGSGETYANCPNDCCNVDCSAKDDTICHSACAGFAGCSAVITGCDDLATGARICLNAITWTQCCSGAPTSCSVGEYCTAGFCGGCSIACDNFCESAGCFGVDPDCDVLGDATGECCGNGVCDGTEKWRL